MAPNVSANNDYEYGDGSDRSLQILQYEIFYKELHNNSNSFGDTFGFDHNINVSATSASVIVAGLTKNTLHQFFIVTRNLFGTSLPTSVITLNTSRVAWDGQMVEGKPSPPHQIVTRSGADHIMAAWTAPSISDPEGYHKYK